MWQFVCDFPTLFRKPTQRTGTKHYRRIGILRLRLCGFQSVFPVGQREQCLWAGGFLFEDSFDFPRAENIAHRLNDGFDRHRLSVRGQDFRNLIVSLGAE